MDCIEIPVPVYLRARAIVALPKTAGHALAMHVRDHDLAMVKNRSTVRAVTMA